MSIRLKICAVSMMALSIAGAGAANAASGKYTTSNGMRVVGGASDPGRFDILQKAGSGASDYWCGAGEYVIRFMGQSPGTRIFLVQPLSKGRLGRNSIGYSINPGSVSGPSSAVMSMKKVGENWSAEHARSSCPRDGRRR